MANRNQRRQQFPPPTALGFPDRFSSYRAEQVQALLDVTCSDKRITVVAAPTGIGKSLIGVSVPLLQQARGLVLTSTKILQGMYLDTASQLGMQLVQGASNYRCPALESGGQFSHLRGSGPATADRGPCKAGISCPLKQGGCPQYDALRAATAADLVVGNYDWWLSNWQTTGFGLRSAEEQRGADPAEDDSGVIGKFDYLILDEAHAAEQHVSKSLHIDLDVGTVRGLLGLEPLTNSATVDNWRSWAAGAANRTKSVVDELTLIVQTDSEARVAALADLTTLKRLSRTLESMRGMYGRWVTEPANGGRTITFDPVWSDRYVEERLFRGIPHVVLMSATIRPAEMKYLGVEPDRYDFFEYDSPFHPTRRPIYQWPVVRMHWKMSAGEMRLAVRAGDRLIEQRLDRKGLVQTVSYKRVREIQSMSKHRDIMLIHDSRTTAQTVERFKRMPPPAVLLSPSLSTGYDFPGTECEYIWIPKVPYPSMESAVMKAKMETDRFFSSFYAAKEIVQQSGRHMRGMDDRGETIITDAAFGGLLKNVKLFPKWWLQGRRWTDGLPPVAKKL